jgi:hypothetical protein
VQAQQPRRTLEGAEQDRDAPVLPQVRHRLDPAPHQVDVGDGERVENRKALEPFGREVHETVVGAGRRGDEEDPLLPDELGVVLVELGKDLAHGTSSFSEVEEA